MSVPGTTGQDRGDEQKFVKLENFSIELLIIINLKAFLGRIGAL